MSFNRHDHHHRVVPKAKVVVGLVDFTAENYEKGKADTKLKMKGNAYRCSYPIHIYRVFHQGGEKDSKPSHGDVLGDGRLPDLRDYPPRTLADFRELIAKLIYLTAYGIPQEWCPHRAAELTSKSYKMDEVPIWWPPHLEFKDPNRLKGATARRAIREAVVRCYHLFNQLELLDSNLKEMANKVVPRVAPGELPLSTRMMQSFYAIYMKGSPLGIDE